MKDYMTEPDRTLQLLDEAEANSAMPLNIVDELRSVVYRNMYRNKSALHYARGLMSVILCHTMTLRIC